MGKSDLQRRNEAALVTKVADYRREGIAFGDIAERLSLRGGADEARTLALKAYQALTFQRAGEIRAEVEGRLDDLTRRVNVDLNLAESQPQRTALYGVALKIEQQRVDLLGLKLAPGTPDEDA